MVPPPDVPVSLRDAEIAQEIARAASRGRAADRRPTFEQLLAAFGESDPTPEARRRVAAALALAGVRTEPSLDQAEAGQRVTLGGERPPSGTAAKRALAGAGVLVLLLGGAGLAAGLGAGGDGGERLTALPAGTTSTVTTSGPAGTEATTATSESGPAATSPKTAAADGEAEKEPTTTSPGKSSSGSDSTTASSEKKRETKRTEKQKTPTRVTVRLRPAAPTFLCADDGNGKILFNGTLSAPRVFKGKRVRLNVGLASTKVLVNGKSVPLNGSPAGLDITRKRQVPLPLGRRPAC